MTKGTQLSDMIIAHSIKMGDIVPLTWITKTAAEIGGLKAVEPFGTLSGDCVRYKFSDGSNYETPLCGEPFPIITKRQKGLAR